MDVRRTAIVIVVDSSVWIDHFRERETPEVQRLRDFRPAQSIVVGDLIMVEVLQGARDDLHAARLERALRSFQVMSMIDPTLAVRAALHYRHLRSSGVTVRRTVDLIIGTFCIERGLPLLQRDRDFDGMAKHLGLRLV